MKKFDSQKLHKLQLIMSVHKAISGHHIAIAIGI